MVRRLAEGAEPRVALGVLVPGGVRVTGVADGPAGPLQDVALDGPGGVVAGPPVPHPLGVRGLVGELRRLHVGDERGVVERGRTERQLAQARAGEVVRRGGHAGECTCRADAFRIV